MLLKFLIIVTTGSIIFITGILNAAAESIPALKPDIPISQTMERTYMIGKWYGTSILDDGRTRKWTTERYNDGTFEIFFRTYNKNSGYKDQIEVGYWGVSGQIYFSITTGIVINGKLAPTDPTDPYLYDAYYIIKITKDEFEYKAESGNATFDMKKVPDNFELPEKL